MGLVTTLAGAEAALNSLSSIGNTAWNVYAQNKTWNREDTAVQRRAADLQNAGLSKTLAAGNAASTNNPIQIGAPKTDIAEKVLSSIQQKKNIAVSDAQAQMLQEQIKGIQLENAIKNHDYGIMLKTGLMKDTPEGLPPAAAQGLSLFDKWFPSLKKWWNNLKNGWEDKPVGGTVNSSFAPQFKFSPKVSDYINGRRNNLTGGVAESTAVGEDSKSVYSNWRLNSNERMQEYYMNQGKNGSFGNKYR